MTAPRKRLYFDNAATSFPKPSEVAEAVHRCLTEVGASPGRGAYAEAIEAGRIVTRCRDLINKLIHGESADHIVFTLHTTDALNLAIKGIVNHHRRRARLGEPANWPRLGEPFHHSQLGELCHQAIRIVTTVMDHNSILRPMNAISPDGVEVTRVLCHRLLGRPGGQVWQITSR